MDYKMEELIPIVAELAKKCTGCDSTSITYEKAQRLMEGVIYCLEECKKYSAHGLTDNSLSVKEQYRIGSQLVLEKAMEVRTIYNEVSSCFDAYNVQCLKDTVQKEFPRFFKWYDAKYCPQNSILTWDYPLLQRMDSLRGVDAVHRYICGIRIEQAFLDRFERNYVIDILNRAVPDYKEMLDNVCEIVLLNTVGHAVLKKPFCEIGFRAEEYEILRNVFRLNSVKEIERVLRLVLKKIAEQIDEGNGEVLEYFECAAKDMAVRIDTAVKTGQLNEIFVM